MTRCPKCESSETLDIRLVSQSGIIAIPVIQEKKMLPKYSKITARACTKCGLIFNFKLDQPEKLAPFVTLD